MARGDEGYCDPVDPGYHAPDPRDDERRYTIDGSRERFGTEQQAQLAAASMVAAKRRSVAVYKDGELIGLRRF